MAKRKKDTRSEVQAKLSSSKLKTLNVGSLKQEKKDNSVKSEP